MMKREREKVTDVKVGVLIEELLDCVCLTDFPWFQLTDSLIYCIFVDTYIQAISQQPKVFMSGLTRLFVSSGNDVRDGDWQGICGSSYSQGFGSRVDHDNRASLNWLQRVIKERGQRVSHFARIAVWPSIKK